MWRQLGAAKPLWLLAAVGAATLTFPLRAVRWRYLLYLEGQALPFRPLWHAVAIGFMANNILPARAGELARAYAARHLTGVRFSTAFASVAVERIFDGVTLVALLLVAILAGGFGDGATVGGMTVPHVAALGGALFGAMLVAALIVVRWPAFALGLARRMSSALLPARWSERLVEVLAGMVEGLSALTSGVRLLGVAIGSLAVWSMNALSFWLGFQAFGLTAPWSAALLLQGIIAFGVAIPSSPGFVGVFEGAARVALALYGIEAARAVPFAIGYHVGGFIPITLLGFYSLWRAGMHMRDLQRPAEPAGAPVSPPGDASRPASSG